ncbi:hypothetical protein [Longimicrobium sp.]|uniref:hypothetical protein n=1 Tax=Longimicrobium sp. TaxID=2029185 RepID=UPI002C3B33E0|nr:hypothetical protein [Longimicrobium sp.]HSU15406.1 hypothetical protein [Longimicrobium sp.]
MDIRLVRGRNQRVWFWTIVLVGVGLIAITAAAIFGDPTAHGRYGGVGAAANFGSDRAPVLPVVIEPFENVDKLTDRELGRVVHLVGTAETGVRRNAIYVRTPRGRRILLRFEPAPTPAQLRGMCVGCGVNVNGYLQKISRAEFNVWMDTLRFVVPRAKPGVKFGDLPDSSFMRIDSLFVKDYYVSVRPEGILRGGGPAPVVAPPPVTTPPPAAPAPAPAAPAPPPAITEAPPPEPTGRDTVRP